MASRTINGIRFVCERPGNWLSEDGTIGIYHMMKGTRHQQWECYRSCGGDPLSGELIDAALTMGELTIGTADLKGRLTP